jgi:putative membrane-bound dehydrogenase-like protein
MIPAARVAGLAVVLATALFGGRAALSSQDPPNPPAAPPQQGAPAAPAGAPGPPGRGARGGRGNPRAALYAQFCAGCHGPNLQGGSATSLVDDEWKNGSDDASIARVILEGVAGTAMAPMKHLLDDQQVRQLVYHIREQAALAKGRPQVKVDPDGHVVDAERQAVKLEVVARNLETPWGIAFLPDGRMLVTERPGRLRIVAKGELLPAVKGTPDVWTVQDGGLFDVEVHPNYARNGWIYLSYAEPGPEKTSMTAIVRGRIRNNTWVDQQVIFKAPPEYYTAPNFHYGSRFAFDREGHLFYSIGDKGRPADAQDLSKVTGKIHRITDDGKAPKDNPFVGKEGAVHTIWSYGHRNPQGLAFDSSGRLWASEHGPTGGDELNRVERGRNYGWAVVSYGLQPGITKSEQEGMESPAASWNPAIGPAGIVFASSQRYPGWRDSLFLSALAGQHLRRLEISGDGVTHQEVVFNEFGRVRDIVTGPDGYFYVSLSLPGQRLSDTTAGVIVRLLPVAKPTWPPPVQRVAARSPALSPAEALKTFHMPPGYRLELVASEPMVVDPILVDFDPDGRMWVVEMLGFMPDRSGTDSREPTGRVAVLEDLDDDGRMDRRTVFLDKLILPRALKVLDRGVLVGEPPNLWLARDTNGDLRADTSELVRNDYGRLAGNPEHNANSLHWGLDNWIYTSEHGYHLQLKDGQFIVHQTLSRGQWGIGMDDGGRIYRNWNEQPLFVDVLPAKYYARNTHLARTRGLYDILMDPKDMTVWPVRPTRGINRGYRDGMLRSDGTLTTYVSAGTPVVYRGDRLPRELYGDAFVTESAGNLVHRLEIVDDGSGRLSARNAYPRGEFLASTDERFRPVNLSAAPDGTLYVVDMYRGVIQDGQYWTDYLRDYIKTNDLELPVGLGRIWRVVHDSTRRARKPSLSKATPAALVRLLSHPNGWHRETAHRLLVERNARSAAPALKRLASTATDYRAKLHALWVLDGLDAIDAATVTAALKDKSSDVRASAIRLAERWLREPGHPVKAAVLARMEDTNWIVRQQLAASLGELPQAERVAPIAAMLQRYGSDPITVDAAISGLQAQEAVALDQVLSPSPYRGLTPSGGLTPVQVQTPSQPDEAVAMLAAAIVRSRDAAAAERLFDIGGDAGRPAWQRAAVLRGAETGLDGAAGGRGGGGGGGRGRGAAAAASLTLPREPAALTALAGGTGDLADVARRLAGRVSWPGKPAPPVAAAAPLTAEQQQRFAQGQDIYKNLCVACHQPDGQGREKVAPTLINSPYVTGDPGIAVRIVIAGKEGKIGLMPPLGVTLTDDQIAAALTYIRREWGHTASPVAPADVREIRGMTAGRKRPWTEEEIARMAGRGGRGRGSM